ncbi:MAG TPA: TetR/AcrR family transcriptional regulator [Planctomycetota bacterium]|nr:TetR/AcrR family transcriptional regulator [Planctomycetota bacterium]
MKHLTHEERRKRIVRGAMSAFAESGFRGTRSRDLARAAGVSEALIFKHFPNKRAIQRAIIEERIRQTGTFLPAELREMTPEKALVAIATRVFEAAERDPTFMRLLYFAGLESEPLAPMFFKRRVSGNIGEVAALVRFWIRRGLVRRSLDARLFAWSFMSCLGQLVVVRHIFGVKRLSDRPGDPASRIVSMFLQGVKA